MLPERDRSNLAYDYYDEPDAVRDRRSEEEQRRERRENEIKTRRHSVSRSGSKAKLFFYALVVFGVLMAVNVQNTREDDAARMVEDQQELLDEAEEENSLLQSRLDSKVNISYIEEYAGGQLNMTKVTNSQIKYLSVNTEDLIEVTPEESGSVFSAIADWFGDLMEYIGL